MGITTKEIKEMSEGERTVYLITVMDSNCEAVKQLITSTSEKHKSNTQEHRDIQKAMRVIDTELFSKIEKLNDKIEGTNKEKISNKLFYTSITLIVVVLLAFSGTLFWSGKEITGNKTRINHIEAQLSGDLSQPSENKNKALFGVIEGVK